jgi:hypothetical protein
MSAWLGVYVFVVMLIRSSIPALVR